MGVLADIIEAGQQAAQMIAAGCAIEEVNFIQDNGLQISEQARRTGQ
jgi:hypothetical protein